MLQIERLDWIPLICVRPIGDPSDAELSESLARITACMQENLRRNEKAVMILDMLQASPLPAAQRRVATAWMKANTELFERTNHGAVFAIQSPLVRGVLTAMLWFQPVSIAHEVVGTLDAAVRWAIQQLESRKIDVPDRARRDLGRLFASSERGA